MTEVLVFVFGTIVGSGINALDYRFGTDKSWLFDRSACPKCGHMLQAWELIPVVSFVLLGRRCSACDRKISFRYPLVELAAGGLFVLTYITFSLLQAIFASFILTVLLFIYVHDARTLIIPNRAMWSFNTLAFLSLFIEFGGGQILLQTPTLIEFLAGPLLATPLFLLWYGSSGKAMGFGDVKLTLGFGWLLGISVGLSAVVLAFWVGAVVSLGILTWQRLWKSSSHKVEEKLTMKSVVPFGPFLIIGFILVYLGGVSVLSLF